MIKAWVLDLLSYAAYYDRYLCQGLERHGVHVTLCSVSPYDSPDYLRKHALRLQPGLVDVVARLGLRNQKLRRALMAVECSINLMALTVRAVFARPDVLHVQWIPLARKVPFELWFLKALHRLGVKQVFTVHNLLPHDTGEEFKDLYSNVYRSMDALICHNQQTRERLVSDFGLDVDRISVVPHGPLFDDVPLPNTEIARQRLNLSPHEFVVLWQGIVRPYKGLEFLLQAWERVQASDPRARLVIAGSGDERLLEWTKAFVTGHGLAQSVRLDIRFIPDEEMPYYYQAADVLVYPYRAVTTSGAVFTGMRYRKAIVASDLPAFRELLDQGKSARLVHYGDVDSLSRALLELGADEGERDRLAMAAASCFEKAASWEDIGEETRRCYEAVLQGDKRAAEKKVALRVG